MCDESVAERRTVEWQWADRCGDSWSCADGQRVPPVSWRGYREYRCLSWCRRWVTESITRMCDGAATEIRKWS